MDTAVVIRPARPEDAETLLGIYAYYVEHTAITFEWEVPELEEFRRRVEGTLERYPYLVAEGEGAVLGYACLGPFVGRAAYSWAAETTVYLDRERRGMGLGRRLYTTLENVARAQNIWNLNACIGYPREEDEYLNRNSAQFHAHLGYRMVGEFHRCGYKFGRWYDMVWMEKLLGEHPAVPAPVIPFPALPPEALRGAGVSG